MPTDRTPNSHASNPLRSEFSGDPDMRSILELFVQEMPERVRQLHSCWERREFDALGRIAHQLKGAGGGYGFPLISDVAGRLEKSVDALGSSTSGDVCRDVKNQIDALVDLCSRATAS